MQAYIEAWRLGVKAIAIYRDGSKRTQPLNTSRDKEEAKAAEARVACAAGSPQAAGRAAARSRTSSRSPATRATSPSASTRTGCPGEIFLVMAKEGSTISGFADAFAQAISYALQYGVPLQDLVDKFSHVRFEPAGITRNPQIRIAKSIVDYVFRWLATKFLSPEAQYRAGVNGRDAAMAAPPARGSAAAHPAAAQRRAGAEGSAVCDYPEPGGCAAVHDVRGDHGAQRQLLQVRQLRQHVGLRVMTELRTEN